MLPWSKQLRTMNKKSFITFPALSSTMAIPLASIYLMLRYPFQPDYIALLKVLFASFALVNLPYYLYLLFEKKGETNFYLLSIASILSLLLLLSVLVICHVNFISYFILFLGGITFLITIYDYFKIINRYQVLNLILIGVLSMWISGLVWEGRILTPLFLEKLISGFYN